MKHNILVQFLLQEIRKYFRNFLGLLLTYLWPILVPILAFWTIFEFSGSILVLFQTHFDDKNGFKFVELSLYFIWSISNHLISYFPFIDFRICITFYSTYAYYGAQDHLNCMIYTLVYIFRIHSFNAFYAPWNSFLPMDRLTDGHCQV